MSAADAATFLGQCETSGVDTSAVMAGLKKALVNASKEGISMKDALSDLRSITRADECKCVGSV